MNELIWINGEVMRLADAKVGVEDRGYQFADGVYEVIRLYDGRPFTLREHLDRLEKSAAGIRMTLPMPPAALALEVLQFVPRAKVRDGMVYLQATRGCAARNHVFPKHCKPTVLFYVRELAPLDEPGEADGAALHTVPDERWRKCWIKSIALLPNVLAKNDAVAAGADEAVFVEGGVVSECSASNLFVVRGGKVMTHPVGPNVLPGITRAVLQQVAKQVGVEWVERPLRFDEAQGADEVFITSTTREISWVSKWDGKSVGGAKCGPVTLTLHRALRERVLQETAVHVGPAPSPARTKSPCCRSHPGVVAIVPGVVLLLQVVEQVDDVGVVELEPFRDGRRRAAAPVGEHVDDPPAELGVDDFADADHGGILSGEAAGFPISDSKSQISDFKSHILSPAASRHHFAPRAFPSARASFWM